MAKSTIPQQTTPQITIDSLRRAAKTLDLCAKAAKTKFTPSAPKAIEIERLVGFGIACDWLSWAKSLKSMTYSDKRQSKSDKQYGLQELTRFTFMWTAANALFSRPSLIDLLDSSLGPNPKEFDSFRVLFEHCGLASADIAAYEKTLHSILTTEIKPDYFPWASGTTPITILDEIYFKYTVAKQQGLGIGKKLHKSITTKKINDLDLPTLIYAARNWNIHGVLITTSFRGPIRKFNLWVDTINKAQARILEGASAAFKTQIDAVK
jgi:hypothetical protein